MVTFALNMPILLLRNDAQGTVTAVHQTPVVRAKRCRSMRNENMTYKYVVGVQICVTDSFTPETNRLRAIIMECAGVIGLERPGPNLDSLAIDPAAMRKEEERFYHFGV